ncbi:MAG: carbon storage regulator [Pirellulales bacterium]
MLVLSRKEGEEIVIGDNIKIVISRIDGNRVSVGIEAPKDVKIIRSELSGTEPEAQKEKASKSPRWSSLDAKPTLSKFIQLQRQVG